MNKLTWTALALVILCALQAAASAPVAVRVEVNPVGPGDGGTRVELTVGVSPEDRSRIGKNAMVRVELDGEAPPGQSPLWAVRMAADGTGRIETVWPAGEHDLRVVISNPSGTDTGLWVGTVRIPGAESPDPDPGPVAPVTQPQPAVREPVEETAAGETPAPPEEVAADAVEDASGASPVAELPAEEAAAMAAVSAAESPAPTEGVEGTSMPESDSSKPEPTRSEEAVAADETPDAPVQEAPASVEADEGPVTTQEEPSTLAEPGSAPAAAADAAVIGSASKAAEAPAPAVESPTDSESATSAGDEPVEPEAAVVEPLRPSDSTSDVEPGGSEEAAPDAPSEGPVPAPAEVSAILEPWVDADPGTVDLTVVALRGREPVSGLEPTDFRLRIGGVEAPVAAVGDASRAPLQLGVAVHVASEASDGWSRSGGRLYPLVERASGGRGHAFFAAGGRVGRWDEDPTEIGLSSGSSAADELTSLIVESLAGFRDRRGRKFLIVVTDGRSNADKAAWKAATTEAENAGVPVLVVALWDEEFSHRVRKNLKTVAEVSGGSLFLVQGSDQLDRAAERFGPMIDAGVALRFAVPSSVSLPAKVVVEPRDGGLQLSAPQGIR